MEEIYIAKFYRLAVFFIFVSIPVLALFFEDPTVLLLLTAAGITSLGLVVVLSKPLFYLSEHDIFLPRKPWSIYYLPLQSRDLVAIYRRTTPFHVVIIQTRHKKFYIPVFLLARTDRAKFHHHLANSPQYRDLLLTVSDSTV